MTVFERVCRKCEKANTFKNQWVEDTDACWHCGSCGYWRRPEDPVEEPAVDLNLSRNDKLFLRSLRISPE